MKLNRFQAIPSHISTFLSGRFTVAFHGLLEGPGFKIAYVLQRCLACLVADAARKKIGGGPALPLAKASEEPSTSQSAVAADNDMQLSRQELELRERM